MFEGLDRATALSQSNAKDTFLKLWRVGRMYVVGRCTIEEGGYDNKDILAATVMAKCLVHWASMEMR